MMRVLPFVLFIATVAFAASPWLTPGFGGFRPDQFPVPQDNPPVQPAGWTFAIWGVIYLWLIAGTGFGALRRAASADWADHRLALLASVGPGIGWLLLAQQSFAWATVLIWIMWAAAVVALMRAGDEDAGWQSGPIGLYTGWLTAASSVSIGLLTGGYGLLGPLASALVGLGLALCLALAVMTLRPGSRSFPAAVIWALCGVIGSNLDPLQWPVMALAAAGIALVGWRAYRTAA